MDEETGLYYYGARYLNPKYSRWLSTAPALGEYIPSAPINDEAKKNNKNLPGMGGVFNPINFHLYHYAGNNPIRYVDPDGRENIIETINTDISFALSFKNNLDNNQELLKIENDFENVVSNNSDFVKNNLCVFGVLIPCAIGIGVLYAKNSKINSYINEQIEDIKLLNDSLLAIGINVKQLEMNFEINKNLLLNINIPNKKLTTLINANKNLEIATNISFEPLTLEMKVKKRFNK